MKRFWLAVPCLLSMVSRLDAAGNFSGNVLLKPPSARLAAMAEAATSLDANESGIAAFHYNPAAPANLAVPEASVMGQRGIIEDTYASIFYGHPTLLGTFSGGAVYYTVGDIQLIDSSNAASTVNAEKDYSLSFNYAEEFFGMLGTGITLKFLNSKLVNTVNANSFAFDAGVQSRLEDGRLALGFSILNIGSDLKYLEAAEPLPLTVRMGGSYRLDFANKGKVILALDIVKERENDFKKLIGADYGWNVLSIRGGYKMDQDSGKIHAGLGLRMTPFDVDYGIVSGSLGQTHSVSVSYKFGSMESNRRRHTTLEMREKRSKEIHSIRKTRQGRRIKVAVLGLNSLGAGENTAALLADDLFLEFGKFPRSFDVIDPALVRDVSCLKTVGAGLGADKVVTGLLTKTQGEYSLAVQMMDVETGSIEVTEAVKAATLQDMEYEIRSIVRSLAKSVQ